MKKFRFLFSLLLLSVIFFSSCDSNDETPKGEFSTGVIVVNEGNYTDGDGTVSYYNPANGETVQDLFAAKNDGRALGSVVQSATLDGDLLYIVVNNSNKVEVVNANTLVSSYTLNDVKLPRFFITFNGKGYLTEWVSFSDAGRVSVVNLQNHTVETTITTDFGAEAIVAADGKLFVSNNFTNTVSVINPSNNQVTKQIEVEGSPAGFVTDKDDKIWVVCTGGSDANYNPLNDGTLHRINPSTNEVDKTIELHLNVEGRITINKSRDVIYYFKGKKIYQVSTTATTASQDAFITETNAVSFYGIGFDTKNEVIYAADAKGFAVGNGTVFRYKKEGTFIDSFDSGRGPNGFIFR